MKKKLIIFIFIQCEKKRNKDEDKKCVANQSRLVTSNLGH